MKKSNFKTKRTKSELLNILDNQTCSLSNEICELQKFLISTCKTRRKRTTKGELEELRVTLNSVRGCVLGASNYINEYKQTQCK